MFDFGTSSTFAPSVQQQMMISRLSFTAATSTFSLNKLVWASSDVFINDPEIRPGQGIILL